MPCARRLILGHLLALHVTPANVDDRAEAGKLADAVQQATGESVELIHVDQGYTGEKAAEAAKAQGVERCVVKLAVAKKRLRPIAQALGRRTFIRMDDAMQTAGEKLRTLRGNTRRIPHRRFRLSHAQASR
jgi:hypothetical protein